jgi:serine/threonine protein kinase
LLGSDFLGIDEVVCILVARLWYVIEETKLILGMYLVIKVNLGLVISAKSQTELQWHHRHKIALGAASALRYLHEECRVGCIVHRDMRPNNILLTHDFTPMVSLQFFWVHY